MKVLFLPAHLREYRGRGNYSGGLLDLVPYSSGIPNFTSRTDRMYEDVGFR
jgi:hypothetical protein